MIAINPKSALARYNLANALTEKGDLDGAIASYREADRLGLKGVGSHLTEAEVWKKLLPRLDNIVAGVDEPANAAEAAEFSKLCRQPFLKR